MIKQGDIYMLSMAEPEVSAPGYTRPVVVVCAITSNIRLSKAPGNVELKRGIGGLTKDSVVNISQIITADKEFFNEDNFIGKLSLKDINKIIAGIILLIEPKDIDIKL